MSISHGAIFPDGLKDILKERGWNKPIKIYSVSAIINQFDQVWADETFGHIAIGMNANHVGRFWLERGEWKGASPAYRYYVQVF